MKKIIALVLCAAFVLASALTLSSCSCNGSSGGTGKTEISQVDQNEAKNLKPAKAITHGNVSGNAAPEGWEVKADDSDCITYIKKTEAYATDPDSCPYIQFSGDTISAEDLFKSACSLKDSKGESYTTESFELGGTQFLGIVGDDGKNSAYGTANGITMVINYKDVDLSDQTVKDIISGIELK